MKNFKKIPMNNYNFVSILICTKDRSVMLKGTLSSMKNLIIPKHMNYEAVIVDNGSKDDTKKVISGFKKFLPLSYVLEKKTGHAIALNTGIKKCRGDLILMTDDDIIFDKNWLLSYLNAANQYPKAGYFFSKIVPIFEIDPPFWWTELAPKSLSGRNLGDKVIEFKKHCKEANMIGVNIAAPRKILKKFKYWPRIGFSSITGLKGGAETKLGKDIMLAGNSSYYIPNAIIYHRVPKERINFKYLKQKKRRVGRSSVYYEKPRHRPQKIKGTILAIMEIILWFLLFLFYKLLNKELMAKKAYLSFIKAWGKIQEYFYYQFKLKKVYENLDNM